MAKTEEKKGSSTGNKFVMFFKNIYLRIVGAFKDMRSELHKVTWPSRQQLINYSIVVLGFMAFMGVVIGLSDLASNQLVRMIVGN